MRDAILADFLQRVRGRLIVSCQALEDEPLHGAEIMARMALAVWQGGAAAIRANGPADIAAIRSAVPLPLIGIYKDGVEGVYITPTFEHARAVSIAGADVIALDCTKRVRPDDDTVPHLIDRIHTELDKPVLADISTLEDALAAEVAGADCVSSTLSGYTDYSPALEGPDFELLRAMCAQLHVPVVAEGRIHTPQRAREAIAIGAHAVVVGGAITRPHQIAARFVSQLSQR